jgi:hypothetical protein
MYAPAIASDLKLEERRKFALSAPATGCAPRRKGADRGIYIRDRSSEPGCAGCLRVATGVIDHAAASSRRWKRSGAAP